jgi:kindlin 2
MLIVLKELIGVTREKLMRLSPQGELIKCWFYNKMKSWSVNWDVNQFEIIFDEDFLIFVCICFDAKILHEYLGGYIFLSIRSENMKVNNSSGSDDMFYRLTEKI